MGAEDGELGRAESLVPSRPCGGRTHDDPQQRSRRPRPTATPQPQDAEIVADLN